MDQLVKNERKFLEENEFHVNENGVYLYKSKDESHLIKLDYILLDYKDWLIENGIVKPN